MTCAWPSLALAAIAVAVTAGGCTSAPSPRHTATPPAAVASTAGSANVDMRDPRQVCEAFAAAVYRVDTAVDGGPQDAYIRAAPYLSPALAASATGVTPVRQTLQWWQWSGHRAFTEVRVAMYAGDALPASTDNEQHHAAIVTVQPTGRDGWRGPQQRHTVVCVLQPSTASWQISSYEAA